MADPVIHDVEAMKRCCARELEQTRRTGLGPAPYWFERVAILSRKAGDVAQEVAYCEEYLAAVRNLYARGLIEPGRGVARGPRHQAIERRLSQARVLLARRTGDAGPPGRGSAGG